MAQRTDPGTDRTAERIPQVFEVLSVQLRRLIESQALHLSRAATSHAARAFQHLGEIVAVQRGLCRAMFVGEVLSDAQRYATDAAQRAVLTLDVLRQRGDNDAAHAQAGTPPLLGYEHEEVLDGRGLPHPVNYRLLRIRPPEGVEVHDWKRPYMIIDPRAGQGAGIGGFKSDSQVGVALAGGHPVYFVVFRRDPEPGQTLADVMRAEAEFVREIARRHPRAPGPVIVGNCQGGWSALLLAAANPGISGPLVISGAPVATWSGEPGRSPMRYNGGLLGGVVPALLMSDLGQGRFDGAHLVSNFEMLNPGRSFFSKYDELFADVEGRREEFLAFERWWGGLHLMNEAEIRWIIEELFIGNRLARGQAQLEPGRTLDLKSIRSPIIVFTSHGDNITPPQQALNWIVDTYADEHEIRVRGQRIVYLIHDDVGHLGIFVSSSVARKEHAEMASTLKTIEALPPGLYEMRIEASSGEGFDARFLVSFVERKFSDILAVAENDRDQERDFAAVARLSRLGSDLYELGARPWLQAVVNDRAADALRDHHPSRVSRRLLSSANPPVAAIAPVAAWVTEHRQPVDPEHPFRRLERVAAGGFTQFIDLWRDWRDAACEMAFLSIYGTPFMHWFGSQESRERTRKDPGELRFLPEVQAMLLGMDTGGFEDAVIRMLILLADARGSVRRDRLERAAEVLTAREPFASLGPERRATKIREQSVVVEFEFERAIDGLPSLLRTREQRCEAISIVHHIVGARAEMDAQSLALMARIESLLDVPLQREPEETSVP